MSSLHPITCRHRSDMATIFDVFCEIGSTDEAGLPSILTKYPEDYTDDTVLRSAKQFSFPCGATDLEIEAVQLFSFVLTDSNGKFTFGYCRYTPRNNTCLCILSGFAWDSVFYKILNHISLIMNNGTQIDMDLLLTKIYHTDIPNIGDTLNFDINNIQCIVQVPDLAKLPTLREDKYMLEFFNALNTRQMIAIYASLLKERRIIFTSRKLSQLSSCIYAAATLIYPMIWQFVFIPVLPAQLIDMIMAPMPFLIGVPKQILTKANTRDLGDVVIVDLEEKNFQSAHDDVSALPSDISGYLKKILSGTNDMGDYLARTFLRATVMLFGGYRLGFTRNESTGVITWDREKFVSEQKPSYQTYLNSLIGADGVQYLERFVDERLRFLNSGVPKNDEFEQEIANIERNRPQVKEGSNDVIGALKDKVSGMQLGSKLNKLTPKEMRKVKNWTLKSETAKKGEPLSFDNVQWQDANSSGSSRTSSPRSEEKEEVAVANLIDLDSPVKPTDVARMEFDPLTMRNQSYDPPTSFAPSMTAISPPSYNAPPIPRRPMIPPKPASYMLSHSVPRNLPSYSSANPFVDPFTTSEVSDREFATPQLSVRTFPVPEIPSHGRSYTPPTWEKFE